MPDGADPLVVGVLHPPDLDVGALEERTSSGERPLDLRILGYADSARVRQEKAAGVAAPSIAEFVMARLLEVWKDIRALEKMQREQRWEARFGQKAAGRTLAIIGLGSIGMEVARRAHAFDMRVVAVRRHPQQHQKPPFVDRVSGPDGLHDVLAEADAVVVSAAATDETGGLMGKREFAAMRPGSILCNVACGSLVDEEDLPATLHAGRPGAAILDVTRVEPLPEDSPLWSTPGVYLSPHSSTSMDDYNDRLLGLFADNLLRYQCGAPLENLVDPARGY